MESMYKALLLYIEIRCLSRGKAILQLNNWLSYKWDCFFFFLTETPFVLKSDWQAIVDLGILQIFSLKWTKWASFQRKLLCVANDKIYALNKN